MKGNSISIEPNIIIMSEFHAPTVLKEVPEHVVCPDNDALSFLPAGVTLKRDVEVFLESGDCYYTIK